MKQLGPAILLILSSALAVQGQSPADLDEEKIVKSVTVPDGRVWVGH